jgi:hypothetical protein
MPIRQYKVFIAHANGRAPARFTVPAGVTQVEVARDAGLQPYQVRFDAEQGVWDLSGRDSLHHGRRKER